jgi:hypothetical protein
MNTPESNVRVQIDRAYLRKELAGAVCRLNAACQELAAEVARARADLRPGRLIVEDRCVTAEGLRQVYLLAVARQRARTAAQCKARQLPREVFA